MSINTQDLLNICKEAGKAILEIYNSDDFNVETKDDNTPLTKADIASHNIIQSSLETLTPDIPIISEEGKGIDYDIRKNYKKYWCVDPLDGTKEFIKRNGEFTVNIALIEDRYPKMGFIFAPVLNTSWWSDGKSSFIEENGKIREITVDKREKNLITVASRSHIKPEDAEFYSKFDVKESISRGSSLKFCLVAEGTAHLYKRSGPTMEWDTAAGQAIAESAGGTVTTEDGKRFIYNKADLLNPGFIVSGNIIS